MARTGVFLDWGTQDDYDVWTAIKRDGEILIHRKGVTGHHGSVNVDVTMTEAEFLERFGSSHEGAEYRKFQGTAPND